MVVVGGGGGGGVGGLCAGVSTRKFWKGECRLGS